MIIADATFGTPLSGPAPLKADAASAASLINTILSFLTIIGGLWFIFWIIIAAYNWISSEGKPDKLETARNQLVHAVVGTIILIAAYALAGLIGAIMGINFFDLAPFF